ncbi:hypothetical protein JW921_05815, partial [Candidatus Fermentibacterales bacterium]|nr:hypothetical protein [Candidatus Fermentibacterales bacterium]
KGQRLRLLAQTRYRRRPVASAVFREPGGSAFVEFGTPETAVAPGQVAALYDPDDGRLIAGGMIAE